MTRRRIIEYYWQALADGDLDALESHVHPNIVVKYPQSGEVIRGRENFMGAIRNYPTELPEASDSQLTNSKPAAIVSRPLPFGMPIITVVGDDGMAVGEAVFEYPNGERYNIAMIIKVRDDLVAEETTYSGHARFRKSG